MKIKLKKDTMLVIKAGQTVEVDDRYAKQVINMGRAEEVKPKKK